MDNKLIIDDDVKSAFADLLGRKARNVSDIKIEGKHISPKPNPVDTAKQRNLQIYNNEHTITFQPQNIYSPSTPHKNESLHSSVYSTPNHVEKQSLSAANTPSRGSVLASYIQRFRNTPAAHPNERKTEDFWWIKNAKNKRQQQKRPNTAPNPTNYSNNRQQQQNNQLVPMKNDDSKHSSVRSSMSDHVQLLNESKPKQIEYKQEHVESICSSKHSSMSSSPNKSIIDASEDTKSEDSDDSDQDFNMLHPHYNEEEEDDDDDISSANDYMDTLRTTNNHIDFSLNSDDAPIDVDDILTKWRKNRRLKQLASENGMNADFAANKNETFMHSDPIISSLYDESAKDEELIRIKQRLGFMANDHQNINRSAVPTQPFTATIHPIPFPNQYSTNHRPSYTYQQPKSQNYQQSPTDIPTFSPQKYPQTPPKRHNKQLHVVEEEEKEPSPRKILSPRRRSPMHNNESFLLNQKQRREQKAKVERLARIQRQMCGDEKRLFDSPKEKVVAGRKKIVSPKRRSPCKIKRNVQVEHKVVEEEEEELKSSSKQIEKDITIFLSKSIQTKPEILTPKMNKTQTDKLKENVMGYKELKSIPTSDPMELLPMDILDKLNKLEQDGKLNDLKDFDAHFRELLNEHSDKNDIAKQLLEFAAPSNKENEDDIKDNDDEKKAVVKAKRPPLPSPKKALSPKIKKKPNPFSIIDDDANIADVNEEENKNEDDEKQDEAEKETPFVEKEDVSKDEVVVDKVKEEVVQKEDLELIADSEYADASDVDDMNEVDCDEQNVTEEHKSEYIEEPLKETESELPPQSDSDIISNWIKKHPAYYFAPSTKSDSEIIMNFANALDISEKKQQIIENHRPEPALPTAHQMLIYDRNKSELLYNDYTQIQQEMNEIKMSLENDIEILTVMKSCKALRNKITSM